MTKSRPQKRVSSKDEADVGQDRLSELPDDVIINILSCLPTIDAVRTVLLRRFGNLWTFVHSLKFYMDEYLAIFQDDSPISDMDDYYDSPISDMDDDYYDSPLSDMDDYYDSPMSDMDDYYHRTMWDYKNTGNPHIKWFCSFVRNVLMLHKNLSIDIFHLCIGSNDREEFDVRVFLRSALDIRQAKEIRLSTSNYDYNRGLIFPNNFKLTSQFLVTLDFDYFIFKGEFQVELVSLKKLSLNHVCMSDANFQRFVSGCSSLQELVIVNPFWMNNLSFSAPNINKLSLVIMKNDDDYYNIVHQLSLNVPNLRSLYLEFDVWLLNITDVSSVRDCYVNYSTFHINRDEVVAINQMLFGKLQGTEVLQLSCDASKKFLHSIELEALQSRWKRVVMELDHFCASCLSGMYHLIESSQQLEELIIYTTKNFLACIDLDRIKHLRPCVTSQLKTITLHGYSKSWRKSWTSQLQLIEFLLKTAATLDKLVIVPVKSLKKAEEVEFVNHVSSFEMSSPTVRVIFA
ncbi:FBD-associated F-box protein At4g13985-like [Silene latifolia]|uniref:FBD-associated F-box protein At4g13985-like n=1 Tax=Silene latifolia TaxID=37657 RepID=UPI003D77C6C5